MLFVKNNISLIIIFILALLFLCLLFINDKSFDESNIYLLLVCMFNGAIPIVYALQNRYEEDYFDQRYYFTFPIAKKILL